MATTMRTATDDQIGSSLEHHFAAALFDTALPGEADDVDAAGASRIPRFVAAAAARRPAATPVIVLEAIPTDATQVRRRLSLAIVNDNMPFLVDSVSLAITAAGLRIERLLHPIVDVCRDADGALIALLGVGSGEIPVGATRESIIYIELERAGARSRADLLAALDTVLIDVRTAVADWPAMLATLHATTRLLGDNPPPIAPHAAAEAMAFLEWLAADRFTLLGVATARLNDDAEDPAPGGLGLCRTGLRAPDTSFPGSALQRFLASPDPLLVTKSATTSTVHRRVNPDMIVVKTFARDGRAVAVIRFLGLFTSEALATSPRAVPLLRRKVAGVIDTLGFDPKGHTGKALAHVIDAFPRDELFETSPERLQTMALGLLSLLDRPRPKLFARAAAFGRFVSVLVYVPRDDYTSGVRARVGAMLAETLGGTLTRFEVELRAEGLARVHYVVAVLGDIGIIDEAALDARLDALVRGWDDALERALVDLTGAPRAARLMLAHGDGFSTSYRAQYGAEEAAADLVALSALVDERSRAVRLYRRADDLPNQLRLKIYRLGQIIALSDAVPVLENFGLRVIEARRSSPPRR